MNGTHWMDQPKSLSENGVCSGRKSTISNETHDDDGDALSLQYSLVQSGLAVNCSTRYIHIIFVTLKIIRLS